MRGSAPLLILMSLLYSPGEPDVEYSWLRHFSGKEISGTQGEPLTVRGECHNRVQSAECREPAVDDGLRIGEWPCWRMLQRMPLWENRRDTGSDAFVACYKRISTCDRTDGVFRIRPEEGFQKKAFKAGHQMRTKRWDSGEV